LKEYFWFFAYVEPFGYYNSLKEGAIEFLAQFGAISQSHPK